MIVGADVPVGTDSRISPNINARSGNGHYMKNLLVMSPEFIERLKGPTMNGNSSMCFCPVFTYSNVYPERYPKLPGLFHLFFYDPRKIINLTFMDFK